MRNLLEVLIITSHKAANIARVCRENDHLFSLLIQEKSSDEANPRFVQDFKTLADVLIQQTVRYDISKQFPELTEYIRGEENNIFSNALSESITVEVRETRMDTAELLKQVLDGDNEAAILLSDEVHKDLTIDDVDLASEDQLELWPDHYINDLGIWIDPIDSTAEYIGGLTDCETDAGIYRKGLYCATVLIGVYDRKTGEPVIGIINQPFNHLEENRWYGKVYWGFVHDNSKNYSTSCYSLFHDDVVVVLSSSEQKDIIKKLNDNNIKTIAAAGAGYKILTVIMGQSDCYLLSRGTTYKWDTCGPHAILKALGGGMIEYKKVINEKYDGALPEITYNDEKTCNSSGVIAYKDKDILEKVINILLN